MKKGSYYIDKKFRTNQKSLVPGGWTIEVLYKSGESRIYDNVKNTEAYSKIALSDPKVESVTVLGQSIKD